MFDLDVHTGLSAPCPSQGDLPTRRHSGLVWLQCLLMLVLSIAFFLGMLVLHATTTGGDAGYATLAALLVLTSNVFVRNRTASVAQRGTSTAALTFAILGVLAAILLPACVLRPM